MTPDEAEKAIISGYAQRLMLDYWQAYPEDVYVLLPAALGYEGAGPVPTNNAIVGFSMFSKQLPNPCTLYRNGKCRIHASGFKPRECRETMGCTDESVGRKEIYPEWDTVRGRALVANWKKLVNYIEPDDDE